MERGGRSGGGSGEGGGESGNGDGGGDAGGRDWAVACVIDRIQKESFMMEDFSIPETSDGGSYPWQRVGRFEIRLSWKSCGRRSSRSTFNFLFNTTRRRARARHSRTGRYHKLPCTSRTARRARQGASSAYVSRSVWHGFGGLWSVRGPRPPRRAPRGFERLGTKRARCPGHP